MSNAIEKGTQRPTEQEEISASCREIFTTAIKLLETKGQLSKSFFNRHQTHHVFLNAVNYPLQDAIKVKIVAGANLTKAREVSMHVGLLRLDVRKTGVKGEETYMGKEFNEFSGHGEDLNGSKSFHSGSVLRYLSYIRRLAMK